jgi:hypothetical protein
MQYLLDSKKEYTNIILDNITAPICNSIYNLFKSSNNIKEFQTKLANIRNWNSYNINEFYLSILKLCKIKNLSQILNQIIILDIQLKTEKKNININSIKFIDIEDFIYKCIVNASIFCWKNSYLFAHKNLKPSEKQYHLNIIEKNIKKIIKSTIRDSTPFDLVFDNNLFSQNLDSDRKTVVSSIPEKIFDDFDIDDKPVNKIILDEEYQSDNSEEKSPIPQKKALKYNEDNQKNSNENIKKEVFSSEEEASEKESEEEASEKESEEASEEESEDEESEDEESEDEESDEEESEDEESENNKKVSDKKQEVIISDEEPEASVKKEIQKTVKKDNDSCDEEQEVSVKKEIQKTVKKDNDSSDEEQEVSVKKQIQKTVKKVNKEQEVSVKKEIQKTVKKANDSSDEEINAKIVPENKSLLNDDISIYASESEPDIPKTPINSKIKIKKNILNAPIKKKQIFKANSSSEDEEKNTLYKSSSDGSSDDNESNYNSEIRTIKINTSGNKNRKRYYS